ncbi:MAG TPA: SEC-C metal-binding domain-containing protein, partial [Polyangiaceae bacterium]|nr:SEC-C metal-binding domain-containing protein [Polyangiaceae bacterium]
EDIIWVVSPEGAMADRRQEAIQHVKDHAPELADLLRSLPERVPGKMFVLYMGPEGFICQKWESILTLPASRAAAQPRVLRNDPCSCGSGKKYKRCCGASN